MTKIEQLEQDLKEYLKEYSNKYKQCLQEVLRQHNIEEKVTIVYSNHYNIIGTIIAKKDGDILSWINPYRMEFHPTTLKGEIHTNQKDWISPYSYNDFKELDEDYVITKLNINNKEELINAVKGLKNGSIKLEDLI